MTIRAAPITCRHPGLSTTQNWAHGRPWRETTLQQTHPSVLLEALAGARGRLILQPLPAPTNTAADAGQGEAQEAERAIHAPSASTVSFMTISTRSTWCRFQRPSKALRFWSRKGRIWATAWQGRRLVVLQVLLGTKAPWLQGRPPSSAIPCSEKMLWGNGSWAARLRGSPSRAQNF